MQKIVFNAHYLMYFDTAISDYWRALALPYHESMEQLEGDLYVVKATVEFHASARVDDQIDVGMKLSRVGNSSLTFTGAIFRGNEHLITGELIYVDGGLTTAQAGLMLTITTGLGLPLAFAVPHYVATARRPQWLLVAVPALGLAAFLGLMTAPATVPWLWAILLSFGLSGFPAYLSLVGLRARTSSGTAALSGFSQSVGYLLAGIGPFLMGVLSEATGGWHAPLIVLAALCPLLCVLGLLATRRVHVEDQLR
jgi:YbgC/YbaW family acyl-CoA thioester hydrolase